MSTKPQNLPFSCLPRLYFLLSAIVALYLSRVLYKSTLFMQNKPNLPKAQMNVNTVITMNYEQITMNNANKNKPNSNPISNPAFCRLPSVFCLPAKYEMRITNSLLRLVSGGFCSAIRLCAESSLRNPGRSGCRKIRSQPPAEPPRLSSFQSSNPAAN